MPFFFFPFLLWCVMPWFLAWPVMNLFKWIGDQATKIGEIATLSAFMVVQQTAHQHPVCEVNAWRPMREIELELRAEFTLLRAAEVAAIASVCGGLLYAVRYRIVLAIY